MLTAIRLYAVFIALLLIAGETWVVLTTDKYWPLSADDYVACIALLIAAKWVNSANKLPWLIIIWTFMFGNLYAMLFTRLAPGGSGERIELLAGLLAMLALGLIAATNSWLACKPWQRG